MLVLEIVYHLQYIIWCVVVVVVVGNSGALTVRDVCDDA